MPTYFKTCPLLGIYVSGLCTEASFEIPKKWYDLHDRLIFNGFVSIRWYLGSQMQIWGSTHPGGESRLGNESEERNAICRVAQ